MTHLNNALYERIADYLDIMDADELRELSQVCKVRADLLEQEHINKRRTELENELRTLIHNIQDEGFTISIDNVTNRDYILDLNPTEEYNVEIYK